MNRNILSQRRCRFIILLVLVLLTMEGASAQRVQPVQSDQKPKPATSTESATKSFFGAVIDEDEDLVRRLLQQNPALVSVNNEHGTALHFAIGHNKILAILLAKNADPNAKNESGETPLHLAAAGDFTGSAELLLAGKANVNAKNLAGETPLHMAGLKEMAELLLTEGGNIEARDNDGRTPLHAAVKVGLTEVVEYLLSHNADVNAKDEEGNTPLHLQMEPAENRGWIRVIAELLLANKADVNAKNNDGLTPLMLAIELKNKEAIEFIQGTNSQHLKVKALEDYAAGRPDAIPQDWLNEHMVAKATAQYATESSPVERPPEVVLKEFYKWYIHSVSHQIDPLKAGKATLRKYVTLRFIRVIERNEKLPEEEGFDADYFLQTQEDSSVTDKNISISNVAVRDATATAVVAFDDGYPKVKVSLLKEGGVWKIDDVKDGSGVGLVK